MASFETFAVGDPISLVGLLGAPELNGRAGVVISELKEGRYAKLAKRSTHEPAKALAAKPENLARRAPDAAPSGAAASASSRLTRRWRRICPRTSRPRGWRARPRSPRATRPRPRPRARAAKMPPLALGPDDDDEEPTPAENSADRARCCANQAAALLADGKFVGAAHAGGQAAAADATWWKGHYFKGEALLALLEGKKSRRARWRGARAGGGGAAALADAPAFRPTSASQSGGPRRRRGAQVNGVGPA